MGLGCLNPGKCNCGPRVLLWDLDREYPTLTSLAACQAVYDSLGIQADLASNSEYTGDIDDYDFILASWIAYDPSWLADLATWSGRLLLAGDYERVPPASPIGNPVSNAWINAFCVAKGIDISIDGNDYVRSVFNRVATTDISTAMAAIGGDLNSSITVGASATELYESVAFFPTPPPAPVPVTARHRIGNIDYVIHGDGTTFVTAGNVASWADWLEELATVP